MKSLTNIRFTLIAFTISTFLMGCQSNAEKEKAAEEHVGEAKQELQEVKAEANADAAQVAIAEEWNSFKADADAKIKANDARIAELREKMKKSGDKKDEKYEKRIAGLEEKNRELKHKLDTY